MGFVVAVAWVCLAVGVAGFVFGLRNSRRNDEVERGLALWATLAWAGVVALVAIRVT